MPPSRPLVPSVTIRETDMPRIDPNPRGWAVTLDGVPMPTHETIIRRDSPREFVGANIAWLLGRHSGDVMTLHNLDRICVELSELLGVDVRPVSMDNGSGVLSLRVYADAGVASVIERALSELMPAWMRIEVLHETADRNELIYGSGPNPIGLTRGRSVPTLYDVAARLGLQEERRVYPLSFDVEIGLAEPMTTTAKPSPKKLAPTCWELLLEDDDEAA